MRCARCQTINPDAAKFCINCGASLNILCPKCRTELPINAKFCFHCGQALNVAQVPPILSDFTQNKLRQYMPHELLAKLDSAPSAHGVEGERRIITMLFCDVKGSTGMAETLDPEAWVEIMNRVFEEMIAPVYRYEGTIARLMGDAILAFFGAPIARRRSATGGAGRLGYCGRRASLS